MVSSFDLSSHQLIFDVDILGECTPLLLISARKVHTDYVDCTRWVGNLLISKSTDNKLILWRPSLGGEDKKDVVILREYCMRGAEVCWFVRFGLSSDSSQVVCGNSAGKV